MTNTVTEQQELATDVAVRATELSKQYRRSLPRGSINTALSDCGFDLPAGKVAALIGANGAGKSTLLSILAGLLEPDTGSVRTVGRTSFVAQEKPVYRNFKPLEMLGVGSRLNRVWDTNGARRWLERFEVPLDRTCGRLSGGQQAQIAFALALGARPDVLLLDEPLSSLDPLVRREVMAQLLAEAAEHGMTVVLSTHVVAELGGVADHLLLLAHGRLALSGDMDELLESHLRYTGPPAGQPPGPGEVIEARHGDRESSFLARISEEDGAPAVTEPWSVHPVTTEDLVLAYISATRKGAFS